VLGQGSKSHELSSRLDLYDQESPGSRRPCPCRLLRGHLHRGKPGNDGAGVRRGQRSAPGVLGPGKTLRATTRSLLVQHDRRGEKLSPVRSELGATTALLARAPSGTPPETDKISTVPTILGRAARFLLPVGTIPAPGRMLFLLPGHYS